MAIIDNHMKIFIQQVLLLIKQYQALLMISTACLTFVMAYGCGYHFRAVDKPAGGGIQSLAIPLIKSTSTSLGFEGDFTTIIREEFARRSKVPLVAREEASAVLIGTVFQIKTEPVSYDIIRTTIEGEETRYEVTNQRWLEIELNAKVVDRASGKPIWQDKKMTERATFVVSTDPLTNRFNQRMAAREMARRFAKRIYLKTMERF
jgi:hypothetical protein